MVEVTSDVHVSEPRFAGDKVVDFDTDSHFASTVRWGSDNLADTIYDWLCYDFKKRSIVSSHCTIRSNYGEPGGRHLKSWVVETSEDGDTWRELDRKENNSELNGLHFARTFPVEPAGPCRSIRLRNT
jgi:hypothetical protein